MPGWLVLVILFVALILLVVFAIVLWPWSMIAMLVIGLIGAFAALIASYLGVDVQAFFDSISAEVSEALALLEQLFNDLKALVQ